MAKANIVIGSGATEYTFTVPPEFAPSVETIRDKKGNRIGEKHTWPVRGVLAEATTENIASLYDELVERLRNENVTCYFKKDGQVLEQLSIADCAKGPHFSGPRIISGIDGAWSTNLQFEFDIVAEIYDEASGIISNEYEVIYSTQKNGKLLETKKGMLSTEPGISAKESAESMSPTVPSGYVLSEQTITANDEDTEAEYSFTLKKLFTVIPANVRIAERVVSESVKGNRRTLLYQAIFTGQGANDAAEIYLASAPGNVTEKTITTSKDSDTVEINYSVSIPASGARKLELFETITVTGGTEKITPYPIEGRDPVFFKGAKEPYEIIQAGRETWIDSQPPERPKLAESNLHLCESETEIIPGEELSDGTISEYTRKWRYKYLSKTAPQNS